MHSPHKRHKHMNNDNNDNKLKDHFVLQIIYGVFGLLFRLIFLMLLK